MLLNKQNKEKANNKERERNKNKSLRKNSKMSFQVEKNVVALVDDGDDSSLGGREHILVLLSSEDIAACKVAL